VSDAVLKQAPAGNVRVGVQRVGRFLAGMIMPNIGALIAWGFITAFFIPTGWIPNASFAKLVGPMITYLLPVLIGFTGGRIVYDIRGGVIGAIATLGVIVGADVPMFMGAMLVGPGAAWVQKQFDRLIDGKIKAGFEMLVNNFSIGIIGMVLAMLSYLIIGPIMAAISHVLAAGVQALVDWKLLPLVNIFIEPGKVLFLNNAINHGVLGPIGVAQAAEHGKSIVFMLESNPGPGLGILLAYWLVGKGGAKSSAPGAIIIHFFGGIHEIYFPYILMNPKLILAAIAGGLTGTFTFSLLGAGLVATPSPGSIFMYFSMTPPGGFLPMIAGVTLATVASFVVAWALLKFGKQNEDADGFEKANVLKDVLKNSGGAKAAPGSVRKIIFACDAGMGSSAMGASVLRTKVQKAGLKITVANAAINEIPADADIVITHESLADRARKHRPGARHIGITDFLKTPVYDELVEELKSR
jgi:PTS system mannitol-specific IIC component